MNELTKKLQQVMVPKAALIAYEYSDGRYGHGTYYLELHPINDRGRMEAAVPVTYEFMDSLVEYYTDNRQDVPHGKIPANMLWCDTRKGHERYIWYNPPGKRQMFFSERLNIPDGTFHVPGVIYRVSGDRLEIFAYKGEAPAEDSPLFLAPFFNVTGSSVCLGNASLTPPENMTFSKLLEHWEKRFWLSEFSHLGGSRNPTESNLVSVTEKARTNPFDYNELIHYTDRYLLNPHHPVTVFVIGAGGTGSQVATNLARMSIALQALGHPGLHVTVFDPDTVTEANIGRQLFSESELGLNKAVALVTRINRFFGFSWEAKRQCYPSGTSDSVLANIIITCTDTTRSRTGLWRFLKKHRERSYDDEKSPIYWMDFGNAQTTGQVLIGNVKSKIPQPSSTEYLPIPKMNVITEEVPYSTIREKDSGPSCSLTEALQKQDLFINSMLAQIGCDVLWRMLREGRTFYRGAYLNLDTLRVNPIPV